MSNNTIYRNRTEVCVYMYTHTHTYNRLSPFVLPFHPVPPKQRVEHKTKNDVRLSEKIPGKSIMLVLRARVRIQANLLPHYFRLKESTGIVIKMHKKT
jgi:hypothetical protein